MRSLPGVPLSRSAGNGVTASGSELPEAYQRSTMNVRTDVPEGAMISTRPGLRCEISKEPLSTWFGILRRKSTWPCDESVALRLWTSASVLLNSDSMSALFRLCFSTKSVSPDWKVLRLICPMCTYGAGLGVPILIDFIPPYGFEPYGVISP